MMGIAAESGQMSEVGRRVDELEVVFFLQEKQQENMRPRNGLGWVGGFTG